MSFPPTIDPAYLFLAGLLLAIWALFRIGRRRQAAMHKKRAESRMPDDQQSTPSPIRHSSFDIRHSPSDHHAVELHDLARDATAQIDSKMILLQHLITQSQHQIDRLEQLLGELERRERMEDKTAVAR